MRQRESGSVLLIKMFVRWMTVQYNINAGLSDIYCQAFNTVSGNTQ